MKRSEALKKLRFYIHNYPGSPADEGDFASKMLAFVEDHLGMKRACEPECECGEAVGWESESE